MLKSVLKGMLKVARSKISKRSNALSKYKYNASNPVVLFEKGKKKPLSKMNMSEIQKELQDIENMLRENVLKDIQFERKRVKVSLESFIGEDGKISYKDLDDFIDYYDSNYDSEKSDWYEFVEGWIFERFL